MDPDVVEIPPEIFKRSQKKKAIFHDVIDIDSDDDNISIICEEISKSNKGKTVEGIHKGYGDRQVVEVSDYTYYMPKMEKIGPVSGIKTSNGHSSVSHNIINVDDDENMDIDEYSLLQAHFYNVDIPTDIEVPFSLDCLGWMKTGNSSFDPLCDWMQSAKNSHVIGSSSLSSLSSLKVQGSTTDNSSLQIKMDNVVDCSSGTNLSLYSKAAASKMKSATSQHSGRGSNHSPGVVESSKSRWFTNHFPGKMKPTIFDPKKHGSVDTPETKKLLHDKTSFFGRLRTRTAMKAAGSSSSSYLYPSNFTGQDGPRHPPIIESVNSWLKKSSSNKDNPFANDINIANPIHYPLDPSKAPPQHMFGSTSVNRSVIYGDNRTAMDTPVLRITDEANDETLRKFRSFKKFDTVNDASDHHFIRHNSNLKQNPKTWAKKIQEEWKILEKDLPDSIFVRVYESRMDLLRAVIIGAEGTPYHDGLFFFDVYFPSAYPNVPPLVHYHSGGLRLNPNLYNCGKVCLSLLNTWSGSKNEKWRPGFSTILQVLVSIQGLILNARPFFNEPGYESMSGSASGEKRSLRYNEDTLILSLKTMTYMMKKPPKHFEEFVVGHFYSQARDILLACKAYMEGAQVGCLVKGRVQNVVGDSNSCSKGFKASLAGFVKKVVEELTRIGAKNCEQYLSSAPRP